MDNEVSSRTEEEAVVDAEPIAQLQENATGTYKVQSTGRARKKAQTPHQKKMCAIEHERLVLMNAAYNELRLLLDIPAKASKAEILKKTTLYIKTKNEALKKYMGKPEVSGVRPGQTSSVTDRLINCYDPNELTSSKTKAWSQAAQGEPDSTEELIATGLCTPQQNFNELGTCPNQYTIYVININCNENESSYSPASSDLAANKQTFQTIDSLDPLTKADLQTPANSLIELGTEIESQNLENTASADEPQEQASANSASLVGSQEDWATDEPFGGPKSNIDGSALLPHQYDLYASLSEQLSACSLDRTVHNALECVFGGREDNF